MDTQLYSWQYNGVAPWHEIVAWCMEHLYHGGHCEPNWGTNNFDTFYFQDSKEYVMFLLRWT